MARHRQSPDWRWSRHPILGASIYIAEFATGRKQEFLKVLVELLAAIPSVVWGFIGLSIPEPLIIELFNVPVGLNVLTPALFWD